MYTSKLLALAMKSLKDIIFKYHTEFSYKLVIGFFWFYSCIYKIRKFISNYKRQTDLLLI